MKALVVFDSFFGNTEQIAQAIGRALAAEFDVETLRVGQVTPERLTDLSLLIIGSPTRKFSPSPAIKNLLKGIPRNGLSGLRVAAFDTRFSEKEIEQVRVLTVFVKLFGYAAQPILKLLEKKGGEPIMAPEGFFVEGTEGPLFADELDRAADWGRQILTNLTKTERKP